jgi:hypothetical protein
MMTSLLEKKGGLRNLDNESLAFKETIDKIRLVDNQTTYGCHTWNNKRGGSHQIADRLENFLVSKNVIQSQVAVSTETLPFTSFDH